MRTNDEQPLADAALPPLPDYGIMVWNGEDERAELVCGFTEKQMFEYAREAVAAHGTK